VTADKSPFSESPNLEGRIFRPADEPERREAVDVAFDYRGDVTLGLRSGEKVEGYIFNRDAAASPPMLQMYIHGQTAPRVIMYADIVAVAFSGEDTASGKSWEVWVKKKKSERQADSARVAAEARSRGHL
jgi:hypothetical protein